MVVSGRLGIPERTFGLAKRSGMIWHYQNSSLDPVKMFIDQFFLKFIVKHSPTESRTINNSP